MSISPLAQKPVPRLCCLDTRCATEETMKRDYGTPVSDSETKGLSCGSHIIRINLNKSTPIKTNQIQSYVGIYWNGFTDYRQPSALRQHSGAAAVHADIDITLTAVLLHRRHQHRQNYHHGHPLERKRPYPPCPFWSSQPSSPPSSFTVIVITIVVTVITVARSWGLRPIPDCRARQGLSNARPNVQPPSYVSEFRAILRFHNEWNIQRACACACTHMSSVAF